MLITSTLAGYCPINNDTPLKLKFMQEKALFESEIYKKPFSIDLFYKAVYFQEIEYAGIVIRQAMLETGNFTSDIFLTANNCFGMRLAKTRPSSAIGEYNYHAIYWHWYDSVRDYRLWQDWYKELGYKFDNYSLFLHAVGYATDRYYIEKLKLINELV